MFIQIWPDLVRFHSNSKVKFWLILLHYSLIDKEHKSFANRIREQKRSMPASLNNYQHTSKIHQNTSLTLTCICLQYVLSSWLFTFCIFQGDAGIYECHANNKWSVDMRSFRTDYNIFFDWSCVCSTVEHWTLDIVQSFSTQQHVLFNIL